MRRMPEIEVENGKVKSIDGIAIGGNFVIENKTLKPSDCQLEYYVGDTRHYATPTMVSKFIVFEEHSWKYLFYARYNLKDYQTITKIGEIGTGGNFYSWENSKVLDVLGNPISKAANAYGIPLAGNGRLSFKSLNDQQFGIPGGFERAGLNPGYVKYEILKPNKDVSLTNAQCEALFTFEGIIGN